MAPSAHHPAPTISTHILDTERGVPAVGVWVTSYRIVDDGGVVRLTHAATDADGRIRDLVGRELVVGDYRLEFMLGPGAFFERVSIDIHVTDATRSYHVPLLRSGHALTTYRGS